MNFFDVQRRIFKDSSACIKSELRDFAMITEVWSHANFRSELFDCILHEATKNWIVQWELLVVYSSQIRLLP